MNIKLLAGLIAALGFVGSAAASTTALSFSSTGSDAFVAISGQGTFESVFRVTPTAINSLELSFSSLDGAYSLVKYSFFTDAGLNNPVFGSNPLGYAIKTVGQSTNFTVGNQLMPWSDLVKTSFDLNGATPYFIRLTGTLNDADAVGKLKVTASNATITPVPEPESYAMLLAGLGLIGTIARRRSKAV